jgi:hypothetical protein
VESSVAAIKSTMQEIFRTYLSSNAPLVRTEWAEWNAKYVPDAEDVVQYLTKLASNGLPYDLPMRTLFLDSTQSIAQPRWNINEQLTTTTNTKDFVWPTELAAAMNSVTCDYNLHPPAPRVFAANGPELLERLQQFRVKSVAYYTHVSSLNMLAMRNIVKRKINVSGIAPATSTGNRYYFDIIFNFYYTLPTDPLTFCFSDTKNALLKKLKQLNEEVLVVFHRPLIAADKFFIDQKFQELLTTSAQASEIVAKVNDTLPVTKSMIRQLKPLNVINPDCLQAIFELIRVRERRIRTTYREVHNGENNFRVPCTVHILMYSHNLYVVCTNVCTNVL